MPDTQQFIDALGDMTKTEVAENFSVLLAQALLIEASEKEEEDAKNGSEK